MFTDQQKLKCEMKVKRLQDSLIKALQTQIGANHPSDSGLFARLLMIISNLRQLSAEHKKLLNSLKSKPEMSHELRTEVFGLIE